MGPLVTIGIPIYKRLHYLENVLNVVALPRLSSHRAPCFGQWDEWSEGVGNWWISYYPKPYRFRQNSIYR